MQRAKEMAYGVLSCTGRVTITGMIISIGKQFLDWSAAYRLFTGNRMDVSSMFEVSTKVCLENLGKDQMIVAHMDDTIIRKVGKKIDGTGWRRDPLGPAFNTNLIWAQRFIQLSISLHDKDLNCQSRSIPVDFHHSPSVKKLSKKATDEDIVKNKEDKKIQNLSLQGLERIKILRERLDRQGAKDRELIISVDGSYTNQTVLKKLPQNVTVIGRVRKDIHLNYLPVEEKTKGRNRIYGDEVPTPEEIRKSEDHPWIDVNAWAAGRTHKFNVKIIKDLRWRAAAKNQSIQLVVIRPLGYRLKKDSKMLYRNPAYLICTDNNLSIEKLIQAYIWRWEIEVNFREEKTVNGCGDAQVHNKESSAKLPAFVVAVHSFIHLADYITTKAKAHIKLPKAKWEKDEEGKRSSTNNVLNIFRGYYWYEKMGKSFSDFVENQHLVKSANNPITLSSNAVFYIRK
jgi:hypothetical protein